MRERFPLVATPAVRPKESLKGLVDVWAKVCSGTKSRNLKKYTRRLWELSKFLKQDDALAVTRKDLWGRRDRLKGQGRSTKTINDDYVGVVLTVFRGAANEEVIPAFPFQGFFALKEGAGRPKRRPYDHDDTARVLSAVRKEESPRGHWYPATVARLKRRLA